MYGNIINNDQLIQLRKAGLIKIEPFAEEGLKTVHYPLRPSVVYSNSGFDNEGRARLRRVHTFDDDALFELEPQTYYVFEIEEFLAVAPGIVGHFVPASNLIEQGLSITAGRLEHPFGEHGGKRQRVRFGLSNQLSIKVPIKATDRLAHIFFIDLRGLNNLNVQMSQAELRIFMDRLDRYKQARDAGPRYPDDEN